MTTYYVFNHLYMLVAHYYRRRSNFEMIKAKKVFKRRNQNIDSVIDDQFSAPVQLPMPQNGDLQTQSQIMNRLLQADEKDES